jgi:hypothetical protein
MSRRYTRDQQRKYKAERMKQAALVADRLMGRKKLTFDHLGLDEAMGFSHSAMTYYSNSHNLLTTYPRSMICKMKGI